MFDIDKALNDIKFSTQHPDERLQESARQLVDREIRRKQGVTPIRKLYWAFPAVAAVLAAFVFLFVLAPAADEVSYVTVDINPSVSMQLSASGTVLSAAGENDDAEALLKTIRLTGLRFEEALGTIVQAADTQGYLKDNGHVLVACFGDEPEITQGQIEKTVAESTHREVKVLLLQSNRKIFEEAKAQKLRPGVELLKKQAFEQGIKERDVDEIMGQMAEQAAEKKNGQNTAAHSEKAESHPTSSSNGQSQKDNVGGNNEGDTDKQHQKDKDDGKVNEGSGNAVSSPDKPDNGNNGNQNSEKQNGSAEDKKENGKNEPNNSQTDNADKEEKQQTNLKGDKK